MIIVYVLENVVAGSSLHICWFSFRLLTIDPYLPVLVTSAYSCANLLSNLEVTLLHLCGFDFYWF